MLVTPLLFLALAAAALRNLRGDKLVARYFAWLGALVVCGFFVLGFFADTERISYHWPLPGYVALLPLLPALLSRWPRWLRNATATLAALGLAGMIGYYAMPSRRSMPSSRKRSRPTGSIATTSTG